MISVIEAAVSVEDMEQAATRVAEYFVSLVTSRGGGPQNNASRARGARPAQQSAPGSRSGPSTGQERIRRATRIQRLYRTKRRRAVQEVIAGPPQACGVSRERIRDHFTAIHRAYEGEVALPDVFPRGPPTEGSNGALTAPFTRGEVAARLWRMKNSSPGPDGLTYLDLRVADPGCHVLTNIFNSCLRLEAVPGRWKDSTTILLYKKGDRGCLSNWRPIAMGDTTARLFAALVADRLTAWARLNNRLSASQKGFLPTEGCVEHNFVLQEVLTDAKKKGKEVVVAWLDLANAFGSVPHAAIHDALRRHQVPPRILSLIKNMYAGVATRVRTTDGLTEPIPIHSGVRQGCPLSPIIFNLTFEAVIRPLCGLDVGYKLFNYNINNLIYADDVALVAGTPEGMRTLLRKIESGAGRVGLKFNASKCSSLHLKGRGASRVKPTRFTIQNAEMRPLGEGESYDHLGIPTGIKNNQTPLEEISRLINDVRAVDLSLLAPWQKLDAVASFLLPRLDFCFGGSHVEKGPLQELDKVVKRAAKGWLNLPQRASAELVYLPPREGGGGLLPLADLADALTVAHVFKLLTSKDNTVSALAWESLRETVTRRLLRQPNEDDIMRYLSGDTTGEFQRASGDTSSLWSRARNAARRMQEKLQLKWEWSGERREISLGCRGVGGRTVRVPSSARGQVVGRLRAAVTSWYRGRLLAKPDQGKAFEVFSRCRESNHFMRDGRNTRFADWRFIHRARLGVLPLNGTRRWDGSGDKRCRRCGEVETIPHVLNHCGPHSAARQSRHNAIVDRLVRANRTPGTVSVNRTVEGVHQLWSGLKPDIVIRNDRDHKIVIIDVAVPFENRGEAIDWIREEKIQKYLPLAKDLESRGYEVAVEPFVVGALGSWDHRNERAISLLNINKNYSKMMKRLMVSETIRWSRDIYVEHVSGVRQY